MKKRQFILLMACVLVIVPFFAMDANAQVGNYICTVAEVGPAGVSAVNIMFDKCWLNWTNNMSGDPDYTDTWCQAQVGREKEYMAMAITALSMDIPVKVTVDLDPTLTVNQRKISKIYLVR